VGQGELSEHGGYLADHVKMAAYRSALEEVVRPGDRVLDLGAGTGILGLLALRAGAGRVVAVDRGPILQVAREVAAVNGLDGLIDHVRQASTDYVDTDPFDVVVCDQIGGFAYDAGVLEYFADVASRLAHPQTRFVPSGFRLYLAPVSCDSVRRDIDFWSTHPEGFDLLPLRLLAENTEYRVGSDSFTRLAPDALVASIDSTSVAAIRARVEFSTVIPGRLDGLVGMFEADLSPSVVLTNRPGMSHQFDRWINLYPIATAREVDRGHVIRASVEVRPSSGVAVWRVEVEDSSGVIATYDHNTFKGQLAGLEDVYAAGSMLPVGQLSRAAVAAEVLEWIEDGSSRRAYAERLLERFPGEFASATSADRFLARLFADLT
jgi:protein arginine N-methyltransferase 1